MAEFDTNTTVTKLKFLKYLENSSLESMVSQFNFYKEL